MQVFADRVEVACSAAVSVIVQGHGMAARAVHGHSMTKATVSLKGRFEGSPYLRVTVIDHAGKKAWSNPIYPCQTRQKHCWLR